MTPPVVELFSLPPRSVLELFNDHLTGREKHENLNLMQNLCNQKKMIPN